MLSFKNAAVPPPRRTRAASGNEGGNKKKTKKSSIQRGPLNIPATPPKLARRPLEKAKKRETLKEIAKRVPVEVVVPYFNYPLRKAAQAIGVSVTTLKRLCRLHGIKRWPHRQLSGLNRAVLHLEEKQRSSSDPVIADQLRQLYSRRDIVVDLSFTCEEEPPEPAGDADSFTLDTRSRNGRPESSPARACTVHTPPPQQISAESQGTPHAITPWWHRSPGTSLWQPGGGAGSGDVGMVDASETTPGKRHRGGGGGGGGSAVPDEESFGFRASSVLIRLPGSSPPRAESARRTAVMESPRNAPRGGTDPQHAECARMSAPPRKLPLTGYMLGGCRAHVPTGAAVPVAAAAAVAAAVACAANRDPSRPPSPTRVCLESKPVVTVLTPFFDNREGGLKQHPSPAISSTHFHPLPAHHPSDSIDKQIAELAALNDILFGPEPEDPNVLAATRARATAAVEAVVQGSKWVDAAVLEPTGHPAHGGGGSGTAVGRLPSIARLVAAGVLLNGEQLGSWRSA